MRTLLFLLTAIFSTQLLAMDESCESKYIEAFGFSKSAATQTCSLNDYGRKLVRDGRAISQATFLSEHKSDVKIDRCEEDTWLKGYKDPDFIAEFCSLNYCEQMLVMEGSSAELASQECKEESTLIDSVDEQSEAVEAAI